MKETRQIALVKRYYAKDWPGYKIAWGSHHNLAMHFGYYNQDTHGHDESVNNLNKKLAHLTNVSNSDIVLDAGSGVGGSALWLAENCGCKVTGVNVIDWQNDIAREHATKQGLANKVRFVEADYANTGFASESFTVFWGVESLLHAEDKQAVIDEAYRVLKPGGRIVICEYFITDDSLGKQEKELLRTWFDGWAMPYLLTDKEHKKVFSRAGFKYKVVDWTSHMKPSIDRMRQLFEPIYPFENRLRGRNVVNAEHSNSVEAIRAAVVAFDKGLWRYKAIVGIKPE